MEYIYFLILIVVFQASGEDVKEGNEKLAAPSIKKLTALDGPAVEVEWNSVAHKDVVGYKLKLWAAGKHVNKSQNAMVLGNPMLYENPPQFEVETSRNNTRAVVDDIKLDTFYAIRVAAFTDKEEGPLSTASGIEMHDD